MIINNNIPALNTYRQMGANQAAGQNSMEKLASGLRINNAADDAAGLAISEKMRAQIRGLDQASRNAQDGISMIQTAEGALQESHDILQRMRELATQAANDTNVEVDRDEIQKEVNALTSELNRIGNTTEFNTQKLLNGGAEPTDLTASTTGTGDVTLTAAVEEVRGEFSFQITDAFDNDDNSITVGGQEITFADTTGDIDTASLTSIDEQGAAIAEFLNSKTDAGEVGVQYTASWDSATNTLTMKENAGQASGTAMTLTKDVAGGTGDISGLTTVTASTAAADPTLKIDTDFAAGDTLTIGDKTYTFGNNSDDFDIDVTVADDTAKQTAAIANLLAKESGIEKAISDGVDTITITQGGGEGFSANFQIGANTGQSMTINIDDMRAEALKVSGTKAGEDVIARNGEVAHYVETQSVTNGTDNNNVEYALDLSSHEKATAAISVINDAIETVSAQRSDLGAFQNRLEHTISNLGNASENLSAAESRIRDVDMAREMMEMTKSNILSQASQSMLAQANQAPQSVLQLLG